VRRPHRLLVLVVLPLALLVALAMVAAVAGRHASNTLVVSAITLDGSPMSVVVDPRTDHAFVSSIDYTNADNLTMLDMRTGERLRPAIDAGQGDSALALDERASRLFIAGAPRDGTLGPGAVEVVDTRDGHTITTTLQSAAVGAVAVDGTPWRGTRHGRAFILGGLKVGMLDAGSARGIKTIDVSSSGVGFASSLTIDARTGHGFAIVQKDAKAGLSALLMFDTRRGVLMGEVAAGVNPFAVVTDARAGRAYLLGQRETRLLDTTMGKLLPARLPPSIPVAVDERRGRVFADDSDRVRVLDARSGRIIRTIALAHHTFGPIAVDARTGYLIITDVGPIDQGGPATGAFSFLGTGSISVIDGNTGATLRTVSVGVSPRAIALDGQGRLIVVNGGGSLRVPDAWNWMPAWLRAHAPFLPPTRSRTRDVPGGVTILDLSRL